MVPSRTLATVGVVALLSAALVGCGSSDGTSSDKKLTAAQFRTQANKLCADADKDTESFGSSISESSSDSDVTEAIDKTVARNDKLVNDIDALNAPSDLADDVDSMLDSVRDALKVLDKITSVQDLVTASKGADPFAEVNTKAKALGLDTCAD